MRRPYVIGEPGARFDHDRQDQCRDASGQMHHETASEIQHPSGHEPAAAPNPMSNRHIDEEQPKHREQQHCAEPHAFGERPDSGVMMATVIWNIKNTAPGILVLGSAASRETPSSKALLRSPSQDPVPLKERLYAPSSQSTETRQAMAKHCISTESRFSARTSPP